MEIQCDAVSARKEASPLGGARKTVMERNNGTIASPSTTGETNVIVRLKVTKGRG